jgi:hypothetical protein
MSITLACRIASLKKTINPKPYLAESRALIQPFSLRNLWFVFAISESFVARVRV